MEMEVRFFFEDGATQDIKIQTYYKEENGFLIVAEDGKEVLLKNVSHMIKIKDW